MRSITFMEAVAYRATMISELHLERVYGDEDAEILSNNFRSALQDMLFDKIPEEWHARGGAQGMMISDMGGDELPDHLISASVDRINGYGRFLTSGDRPIDELRRKHLIAKIAHELGYLIQRRLEGVAEAATANPEDSGAGD